MANSNYLFNTDQTLAALSLAAKECDPSAKELLETQDNHGSRPFPLVAILKNTYQLNQKIGDCCSSKNFNVDLKTKLDELADKATHDNPINHHNNIILFHAITQQLVKHNLFHLEHFNALFNFFCTPDTNLLTSKLAKIFLYVYKLSEANLLTQENLSVIFQGRTFDKTCQARLHGGVGLRSVNSNDQQIMWGYYCVGIVEKISNLIRKDDTLSDIIQYACKTRNKIAHLENQENADSFGKTRTTSARDIYSDVEKSVANNAIYPSIKKMLDLEVEKYSEKFRTVTSQPNQKFALFNGNSICTLPQETILISSSILDNQGNHIYYEFKTLPQEAINLSIKTLDETYFQALKKNEMSINDFLILLGKLTFNLSRLYATTRGWGAIVQFIIWSLVKNKYGLELNDIKLGEKSDIPYDIYAHTVQDPDSYAAAFHAALFPILNLHANHPTNHAI